MFSFLSSILISPAKTEAEGTVDAIADTAQPQPSTCARCDRKCDMVWPCCGLKLCPKHASKTYHVIFKHPKCGHARCNFSHPNHCRPCLVAKTDRKQPEYQAHDKRLVKHLIANGNVKSLSLKRHLEEWVQDPRGSKRRRVQEEIEGVTKRLKAICDK